ncbi:coenzyme F420-0:L-glutamate ligase [Ornithinimicrobium sufpigmenti]|uniref:coenzyme F420-0:L-glutamate ligase n=1 Tax=Ornithinimicrobium sufpigmenti TaxID=2508882 RepID=UPI001EDE8B07|nr:MULTISPECIES: coenzyme F420-0:L-glutamate ligase [unclassified Ornithinimicrobium]
MASGAVQLLPLTGVPEVPQGADVAGLLSTALEPWGGLRDGDILVVSGKVLSKAYGLRDHAPREEAVARHTVRVVAERTTAHGTTQVVESVAGPVLAAAGVDASNTGPAGGVLLLPEDPDGAARDLHRKLAERTPGVTFGLVLSDTAGRAWRAGQTDFALGAHGVQVVDDLRGGTDADGRPLAVTARAVGDELAAAADLVKGKAEAVPAALVRGLAALVDPSATGARSLVRTGPGDWFALGHREAVRAALGAAPGTEQARAVGVPDVAPEPADARAARAVRLALLDHHGAEVGGEPGSGYVVRAADPVLAGRVAARLEVALAGEGLDAPVIVA